MFKKNGKYFALGLLALIIAVSGVSAYFTATDTKTNNFQVSSGVDVEVDEPGYEDDGQIVLPNQTITKDPIAKNIGDVGQFVFMSVEVPFVEEVVIANGDGTKQTVADQQLFTLNNISNEWTLMTTEQVELDVDNGDGTTTTKLYNKYVYVYGTATACKELAAGASTPALFESVTLCNAVDGELEGIDLDIIIDVYAIQSKGLVTSENGAVLPSKVLEVYWEQNAVVGP